VQHEELRQPRKAKALAFEYRVSKPPNCPDKPVTPSSHFAWAQCKEVLPALASEETLNGQDRAAVAADSGQAVERGFCPDCMQWRA